MFRWWYIALYRAPGVLRCCNFALSQLIENYYKRWLTANFRLSSKTLQKMYIKQPHLVQTDLICLSTVLPWIVGAAKTNEKCL